MTWDHHYRRQRRREEVVADKRLRTAPLKSRLDFILIGVASLIVLGFVLGWQFLFSVGERTGVFEPPVVREARDQRVLKNFKRDAGAKLVDGAPNRGEGRFYMAQSGGVVHSYDPGTRLWRSEDPFAKLAIGRRELEVLRGGCGMDLASSRAATCADPSSLWALTAGDGLLRRKDGEWREVLSATRFTGRSGRTVDGGDLVAAAISGDQRWMILGTRGEGIGLYDLRQGRWKALNAGIQNNMPRGPAHEHIVFWKGSFWIGGGDGLVALSVSDDGAIEWRRIAEITGNVRDLAAGERLFVLENRVCDNKAPNCVRITRLDSAGSTPSVLMDERNIFRNADLTKLQFAAQQGRMLFLAGNTGLFRYDTQTHAWTKPEDGRFAASLGGTDGGTFYVAFQSGAVIEIEDGVTATKWAVPTQAIVQLFQDESGTLHALSRAQGIWELSSDGSHRKLITPEATKLNPDKFAKLVGRGDKVLLFGPEGGTLHSISERTFKDLPRRQMPAWVLRDDVQLITAKDQIFGFVPEGRRFRIFRGDINQWVAGRVNRFAQGTEWYPGQVDRISPWGADSLAFLDGSGGLWRVQSTGAERLTGKPLRGDILAGMRDLAVSGKRLLAATEDGLYSYDLAKRRWRQDRAYEIGLGRLKRVAIGPDPVKPYLLADTGMLGQLDRKESLIGGGLGFNMLAAEVTDVRRDERGRFYIAGAGRISRYDPVRRRVDAQWRSGSGPVTLLGVAEGKPISAAGGGLYFGNDAINPEAGPVVSGFVEGLDTWTVRQVGSGIYLKRQARKGVTARCLMRHPSSGLGAAAIMDAREISPGWTAVLTQAGLVFYSRTARSWFPGPRFTASKGTRLAVLGGYLAAIERSGGKQVLRVAPIKAMREPDSCSGSAITFSWKSHLAVHLAVDEAKGRAVWLDSAGALHEWQAGERRRILDAPGPGPAQESLRRVFDRGDLLLFTTLDAVWRYDRIRRAWRKTSIVLPDGDGPIADITLEPAGDRELATIRTAGGAYYVAELTRSGRVAGAVRKLDIPAPAPFEGRPQDILDVQRTTGGLWLFFLRDRIKRFDPSTRKWLDDELLPVSGDDLELKKVFSRYVVTRAGGTEWLAGAHDGERKAGPFLRFSPTRGEQVAIDSSGSIWRLGASSRVIRCRPGDAAIDQCSPVTPPPIIVDPGKVTAAYSLRTSLILIEGGRIRAVDTGRQVEFPVSAELAALRGITMIRRNSGRLWILFASGDLAEISDLSEKDGVQIHRKATGLVIDAEGRLWAKLDNAWRPYELTGFGDPPEASGAKVVFAHVGDRGGYVAVMDNGNVRRWSNGILRSGRRLPGAIDPNTVETILPGRADGYWIYAQGILTHVTPAKCGDQRDMCLQISGSVALSSKPTQVIDPGGGVALFATASGPSVRVVTAGRYATLPETFQAVTPGTVKDVWSIYRSRVIRLKDGRFAFDPPVALEAVGKSGELVVRRQSGQTQLGAVGVRDLARPASLDVGWMRWDRKSRKFVVSTGEGPVSLEPETFFSGGQMISGGIKAVLARADGIFAANSYGVWRYPNGSFSLGQTGIGVQPASFAGEVVGAHGRFASARHVARIGAKGLRPRGDHLVTLGRLQFSEDLMTGKLAALYHLTTGPRSPFGQAGFIWDRRRGVALGPGGILLLSDAGVHGLDPENGVQKTPGGGVPAVEIATPLAGGAYGKDGSGSWWRNAGANWVAAETPFGTSWTAVDTTDWVWRFDTSGVAISGKSGESQDFERTWKLERTPDGWTFARDRLLAATGTGGRIMLLTSGATEEWFLPGHENEQRFWSPPVKVDELLPVGDAIYRRVGSEISRWSPANTGFLLAQPSDNPFRNRSLAAGANIRFRFASGNVISELRTHDDTGKSNWKSFRIAAGGMPFDQITDMRLNGDHLYLAGDGGVQIYRAAGPFGLSAAAVVRGTGKVSRVLVPWEAPDLVVARSGVDCSAFLGLVAVPCDASALSGRERLVSSRFWDWWREAGVVRGRYRIDGAFPGVRDGLTETLPVAMSGGRISHDNLGDAVLCGATTATLWSSGVVQTGRDAKNTLAIGENTRLADLSAIRPQRLLCIGERFRSGGTEVEAGLYALGAGGAARHTGSGWDAVVREPEIAAVRGLLRNTAGQEYRFGQMRIAVGRNRETEYAYQDLQGEWHALSWRNGRLSIDDIGRAAAADGKVWVATEAGFLSYTRNSDGELRLKADAVTLIREPREDGKACPVTDIINAQGTIVFRCKGRSDAVYTGVLSAAKDRGVFSKYGEPDPFAKPVYVSDAVHPWKWQAIERVNGTAGRLIFTFKGETNPLSDGRFDFDRITSLAIFEGKKLELAGDVGGWYRGLRDGLPLKVLERPVDIAGVEPKAVAAVGLMRQPGKPLQLCLSAGSVGGVLLAPDGSTNNVAACFEDQGTDGLWTYAKSGRLLVIESSENALRQTVSRRMRRGRFGDDVAGGVPAVGGSPEAIRYLVPTKAGLLTLDESLARIAIAPWGDQAKAADPPPTAYHPNRGTGALFTRDSRVFAYGAEGSKPTQLPAGGTQAKVLSFGDGPFSLVKVRWRDGAKRGFFMGQIGSKGLGLTMENAFPVDVSKFTSIVQRQRRLPGVDLVISVHIEEDKLVLRDRKKTRELQLGLPHKMKLLNYGMFGTKLVLMDAERIVEVDLNKPAWWLLSKKPGQPKTSELRPGRLPAAAAATTAAATRGAATATAR